MHMTMKVGIWKYLLVALACSPILVRTAQAQQWCPPGAEWRYSYYAGQDSVYQPFGMLQYRYMGDSLYEGEMCQYIQSDYYLQDATDAWTHVGTGNSFSTVTAGGAILVYNTEAPGFDTLAWFGAVPGTSWTLHQPFLDKLITVSDTGTREVNGLLLRFLVINSVPPAITFSSDTIYERIGALNLHNFNPLTSYFIESPFLAGVSCYRDNDFSYTNPLGFSDMVCDSPVPIVQSAHTSQAFTIYPNPGADVLHIDAGTPDKIDVRVLDATGRAVLKASGPSGSLELNSGGLSPCVYLVEVRSSEGHRTVKWIKR